MAHVERAGDIRGGDYYRKERRSGAAICMKISFLLPELIPFALCLFGVIDLAELRHPLSPLSFSISLLISSSAIFGTTSHAALSTISLAILLMISSILSSVILSRNSASMLTGVSVVETAASSSAGAST